MVGAKEKDKSCFHDILVIVLSTQKCFSLVYLIGKLNLFFMPVFSSN